MADSHDFFKEPILNSPYDEPSRHHQLDENGQPTNLPALNGRRRSSLYSPVPKAKRTKKQAAQDDFFEAELEKYNPHSIINEIRGHVKAWREIPNSRDWGVTPTTERLLQYWRDGNNFETIRPFFCAPSFIDT